MTRPTARSLLAEVVGPGAAGDLDPTEDLVLAGVDSGDLIRLALLVEDRFDVALEAESLERLRTLAALDDLLASLSEASRGIEAGQGGGR